MQLKLYFVPQDNLDARNSLELYLLPFLGKLLKGTHANSDGNSKNDKDWTIRRALAKVKFSLPCKTFRDCKDVGDFYKLLKVQSNPTREGASRSSE